MLTCANFDDGVHVKGEHNSWHKFTNFELGTRVPLIIRAPQIQHGSAGKRVKVPVELVDVFPTLAAMVGTTPKDTLDGKSLVKHFESGRRGNANGNGDDGGDSGGHNASSSGGYAYSQFPHITNYNCTFFVDGACRKKHPSSEIAVATATATAAAAATAATATATAAAKEAPSTSGSGKTVSGSLPAEVPPPPPPPAPVKPFWPAGTMMGFCLRDVRWRYVVWLPWNVSATTSVGKADWAGARGSDARYDELYDHSTDTEKDFDAMDVVNLAYNVSYDGIVQARFKAAKAFFA